ncbi:MAG: ABC transporter permease subunit [Spirochaetales bacterium]|nr:ABC transporter permease subunit [Spirochaetales bacterium]
MVKLSLTAFLLVTVIFPLITLLANMGLADFRTVFALPKFREALFNSAIAAATASAISLVVAYIFALCTVRSLMPYREVLSVVITVPMLLPSISQGMGLILLLGANGILTRLFGLEHSIYGFGGVVAGSVLYAFPVAFLMFADILKYEDGSPYEAASVLGIPRFSQFFAITFPYLRRPLISVVFATFTLIFTDYGIPLMIGGRFITLPVLMYQEVIGLLNFSRGSVIGSFLLVPAVVAFIFDIANQDKGSQSFVVKAREKPKNTLRDAASFAYCAVSCAAIALPVVAFSVLAFVTAYPIDTSFSLHNIEKTLRMGADRYLVNSLIIALAVASLGCVLSYVIAYCTSRTPGKSSRALHLISITSLAIPGLVLGLSYVLFFKGTLVYGTLAMLILVNAVHFLASPYLMAYNSLGKLNANLEDVGRTLGIPRFYIIKDVLVPQTQRTILEMFSYFFVNSMMTISAVSFLSTVHSKPVSLMMSEFEVQMHIEGSAFVSLLILACNFAVKCLIYGLKRRLKIAERGED